jgi:hypothetical protein
MSCKFSSANYWNYVTLSYDNCQSTCLTCNGGLSSNCASCISVNFYPSMVNVVFVIQIVKQVQAQALHVRVVSQDFISRLLQPHEFNAIQIV